MLNGLTDRPSPQTTAALAASEAISPERPKNRLASTTETASTSTAPAPGPRRCTALPAITSRATHRLAARTASATRGTNCSSTTTR